jgi:serine/threonine-protein kinase HipA
MARPSKRHALGIWMNGLPVGNWCVSGYGVHSLVYEDSWRESLHGRPISLSLPLEENHHGPKVESFFDNLLPDNKLIRTRLQQKYSASTASAFDLLAEIGWDCAGALQLLPEGMTPPPPGILGVPLSDSEISSLLDHVLLAGRHQEDDDFRISVAGAQEKTALLFWEGKWQRPLGSTPTTHLLKLPIGRHNDLQLDLSTSVDNESICSRLLAAYGLPVAPCEPATFGKHRVLVVKRFDREPSSDGKTLLRLPQEDLCQTVGLPSSSKYEEHGGPGIEAVMRFLMGSRHYAKDRANFFEAQILFWMLAAIDGHAKNFSIALAPEGRFYLRPLYDILSAHPHLHVGNVQGVGGTSLEPKKIKMAMAWSGKNRHYHWSEIEPRHFVQTGQRCGLSPEMVTSMLDRLVSQTPIAIEKVQAECGGVTDAEILERICNGLKTSAEKISRALSVTGSRSI